MRNHEATPPTTPHAEVKSLRDDLAEALDLAEGRVKDTLADAEWVIYEAQARLRGFLDDLNCADDLGDEEKAELESQAGQLAEALDEVEAQVGAAEFAADDIARAVEDADEDAAALLELLDQDDGAGEGADEEIDN
jgi:hypothetical protein